MVYFRISLQKEIERNNNNNAARDDETFSIVPTVAFCGRSHIENYI